jgi:hypothetical protein
LEKAAPNRRAVEQRPATSATVIALPRVVASSLWVATSRVGEEAFLEWLRGNNRSGSVAAADLVEPSAIVQETHVRTCGNRDLGAVVSMNLPESA